MVFGKKSESSKLCARDWLRLVALRFFSHRLVTPLTPYVLSDGFLSSEVDKYGWRGLNSRSIDVLGSGGWPAVECPVIFVQVNQLDTFVAEVLPRVNEEFILITGKWHLPGLRISESVNLILANPYLKTWFSQNQIYNNLPILPFPYGVKLSSAPHIYWRMRLRKILGIGRSGIFVPHVASHAHLTGIALEARSQLADSMGPRLKLTTYLNKILRHKYVVSPPGDRMDTYRHWESIALGAIPVSNLPPSFSGLFGGSLLQTSSFGKLGAPDGLVSECKPQPELALVHYWRAIVLGEAQRVGAWSVVLGRFRGRSKPWPVEHEIFRVDERKPYGTRCSRVCSRR